MRYVLTLTIGLLAALAATATTASANDYHRSHRAVEGNYSHGHHKGKRHVYHRAHRRAHRRSHYRGHQRQSPRYRARRHLSYAPYPSRFVIVISPDGLFRIARR